ncbi:hypothetical protein pb186bvf_001587 [Paramecium bursaria]
MKNRKYYIINLQKLYKSLVFCDSKIKQLKIEIQIQTRTNMNLDNKYDRHQINYFNQEDKFMICKASKVQLKLRASQIIYVILKLNASIEQFPQFKQNNFLSINKKNLIIKLIKVLQKQQILNSLKRPKLKNQKTLQQFQQSFSTKRPSLRTSLRHQSYDLKPKIDYAKCQKRSILRYFRFSNYLILIQLSQCVRLYSKYFDSIQHIQQVVRMDRVKTIEEVKIV